MRYCDEILGFGLVSYGKGIFYQTNRCFFTGLKFNKRLFVAITSS